jgi:DNA-binding PadR family transcriptional regulator
MEKQREDIISGLLQELRRGTIILCVLAKLKTPSYGYQLIARMADTGIAVEANTLYPLLRRLEDQGLLHSYWNTEGKRPQKYYESTDFGKEVLLSLKAQWYQTLENMVDILEEESQ